jgi:histidine triad (HIT) family protein
MARQSLTECIFCRIANKEIETAVIYEDESCVAFNDLHPQSPFHALVVPKRHIVNLLEATEKEADLLGHLLLVCNKIAKTAGIAERGFRVVTNSNAESGQSIDHLHFHVLGGRWMEWPPG